MLGKNGNFQIIPEKILKGWLSLRTTLRAIVRNLHFCAISVHGAVAHRLFAESFRAFSDNML